MKCLDYLPVSKRPTSGLSLFEMLTTLMIMGVMVLVVLSFYNFLGQDVTDVVDRRNAKSIISTQRQAMMAGASFSASTRDEMIRELVQGVRPTGIFRDRIFRVSGLDPDSISRAARFLAIEEDGSLEFDSQASQPAM